MVRVNMMKDREWCQIIVFCIVLVSPTGKKAGTNYGLPLNVKVPTIRLYLNA